jgi:hypothetical protein
MESEEGRERVKEHDQLRVAHQDARVFVGLREGEYWRFKCTYKHKIGHVDNYRFVHSGSLTSLQFYMNILLAVKGEHLRGQTAFCIPHSQTNLINLLNPTLKISYIPHYRPTSTRTMYIFLHFHVF